MSMPDWTAAEAAANLAAAELREELTAAGIVTISVHTQEDAARIAVVFNDIRDAETLVSSVVPVSTVPGTLYDRATGACLAITALVEADALDDESGDRATEDAWSWNVHPHMVGRRADWHVSVDMPLADAHQVTTNLTTLRMTP